jgi:TPR repeat protein
LYAAFTHLVTSLKGGYVLAGFELARLHVNRPGACSLCVFLLENFVRKHPLLHMLDEAVALYRSGMTAYAVPRLIHLAIQGFEHAQYNTAFVLETLSSAVRHPSVPKRVLDAVRAASDSSEGYVVRLKRGFNALWNSGSKPQSKILADAIDTRAALWWTRASMQGPTASLAKLRLGNLFLHGHGVPRLPLVAAAYYHSAGGLEGKPIVPPGTPAATASATAAAQAPPVVEAVFNMARLHDRGAPGIPSDRRMARRYYARVIEMSRQADAALGQAGDEWAWVPATIMIWRMRCEDALGHWLWYLRFGVLAVVAWIGVGYLSAAVRRATVAARPAPRPIPEDEQPLLPRD